jgi:hypothetical protein
MKVEIMKPNDTQGTTSWFGSLVTYSCNMIFWSSSATLHDAAINGKVDQLRVLLRKHPTEINALDKYGKSALHHSLTDKNLDCALLLLIHKADPNVIAKGQLIKSTPIHSVMIHPDESRLRLLLFFGADYQLKDDIGYTVLEKADPTWQEFINKTVRDFADLKTSVTAAKGAENKGKEGGRQEAYKNYIKAATILYRHAEAETNYALKNYYFTQAQTYFSAAANQAEFFIRLNAKLSSEQGLEYANLFRKLAEVSAAINDEVLVTHYQNRSRELTPESQEPPTAVPSSANETTQLIL